MNAPRCGGGTQGMNFEKVIFRVRGGLVFGQSHGLRGVHSKNLTAGYLTVTSKRPAKNMQKKHEVMRSCGLPCRCLQGVQAEGSAERRWIWRTFLPKKGPLKAALGAVTVRGRHPRLIRWANPQAIVTAMNANKNINTPPTRGKTMGM
jgi:hypothetical protein